MNDKKVLMFGGGVMAERFIKQMPMLKNQLFGVFYMLSTEKRKNDVLEIPEYINSLGCQYDYYLRGGYHTILWAIPKGEEM